MLCCSGNEYPAIVEYAPFTKVPKKKPKKIDSRKGTIEQGKVCLFVQITAHVCCKLALFRHVSLHLVDVDAIPACISSSYARSFTVMAGCIISDSDYIKFVGSLNSKDDGDAALTVEQVLEEVEAKAKAFQGTNCLCQEVPFRKKSNSCKSTSHLAVKSRL